MHFLCRHQHQLLPLTQTHIPLQSPVPPYTLTPSLFLCHTPTHNELLRVTSSYLQGAGLVRRGQLLGRMKANAKGSSTGEFVVSGWSPRFVRRPSSHADLGTRFPAPLGWAEAGHCTQVQGEWSRDSPSFPAWPRGTHTAAAVSPSPELTTWTAPRAQVSGECGLE